MAVRRRTELYLLLRMLLVALAIETYESSKRTPSSPFWRGTTCSWLFPHMAKLESLASYNRSLTIDTLDNAHSLKYLRSN